MEAELGLSDSVERLRWFIKLRWLAAVGIAVAALPARVIGIDLNPLPLLAIAAFIVGYNLALWLLVRRLAPSSSKTKQLHLGTAGLGVVGTATNAQIALDLITLTVVLHFTGGVTNPFYLYYTFHIITASILLSATSTFLQTGLAVALFTAMALAELAGTIPHVPLRNTFDGQEYRQPGYVSIVVLALASTLILAAALATSIVGKLRARERETFQLKEKLEREMLETQRSCERLREVEKLKSQYMRKASHELKAPLDTVESQLSVIVEGFAGDLPDKPRELLRRAISRLRELRGLVNDLLTLSRSQRPVVYDAREPIDVEREIRDVLASFAEQVKERGIGLSCSVDASVSEFYGDPEGIRNLLSNLVSNAVRYTGADGRVLVCADADAKHLHLTVSDTGIGISPEGKARIFDEFFRAKEAREMVKDGSGLGLAIVKAIVDAHGGSIRVDSEPGKGTVFAIRLPLRRAATDEFRDSMAIEIADTASSLQVGNQAQGAH